MKWTSEALIELRRTLHAHPELSHHEERTAARVCSALEAMGLEVQGGIAGHGLVAQIDGAHSGPVLLYRADMDALPIQEVAGRAHGSTVAGVMHACGHDVHTTIGVGVAARLLARQNELHGAVKLVFQPAEEASPPPGQAIGAERMVEEGVLDGPAVDAAFALHVMPELDVGRIAGTGGAVWASSDLFDVVVRGRMAHGAYPQEGRDAIFAASQVVMSLQQLVARNLDPRDPAVVSVCRFDAGTAHNVLAGEARLKGLIRTLSTTAREMLMARFVDIVETTARACGCEAEVSFVRGAYLTENDPALEAFALDVIARTQPIETTRVLPQLGAEDFSAFSRRVPSCYLFLGVRNEALGITSPIHTPSFDVDERALVLGADAMSEVLLQAGRGAPVLGRV